MKPEPRDSRSCAVIAAAHDPGFWPKKRLKKSWRPPWPSLSALTLAVAVALRALIVIVAVVAVGRLLLLGEGA